MPFVKLDCGIIHSSVWAEDSDTRICWITLLVLADPTGMVRIATSALAREAGVSAEAARKALELFQSPDDESRSPENKGKRIEKLDGGYQILNYTKYREFDHTAAARQKRFRERQKNNGVTPVTKRNVTLSVTQAEAEAEAEVHSSSFSTKKNKSVGAIKSRPAQLSIDELISKYESNPAYIGLNVRHVYDKMLVHCSLRGKKPTERRFVDWLNREDKPIATSTSRPMTKYDLPLPAGCSIRASDGAVLDYTGRVMDINQVRNAQ